MGREVIEWWSLVDFMEYSELFIDPFQIMVRAGAEYAKVKGTFSIAGEEFTVSLKCNERHISIDEPYERPERLHNLFSPIKRFDHREQSISLLLSLLGMSGEPMVFPPFLYFNSYRKIQEGNPELRMMMSGETHWRRRYRPELFQPFSAFKMEIIRALMGQHGLFESVDTSEAEAIVNELNGLIEEYAHATLAKLRQIEEGAVELRVNAKDSENTYPFDGLTNTS